MNQWIDWLINNRQWVFSGIGVAVVTAIFAFLRWLTTRQHPPQPPPNIAAKGSISPSASEGGGAVVATGSVPIQQSGPPDIVAGRAEHNRQRILERVHHFWIEGVLSQSLYHVARIELRLAEEPEGIELPWKLIVEHPERTPRQLPDGTPMHVVFDQFDKTLLILGAPGSGKTTLLLELTRDLIKRAKQDPQHPIPVVFNLSSWALRCPSLEAWLVDELCERYDVPRRLAERCVEHEQVLPLLDGLDEVALEHRSACVEAINAFRKAHGLVPLAVCSRAADYEALIARLRLTGAVTIQPLTRPQVDRYLRRAALFEAYIKAMFRRREASTTYTPQQTRHWLSWLAQAMVRYDQTVFYLE